jgi:hypothetical protein
MTDTTTADHVEDTPQAEPVAMAVYVALDAAGNHIASEDWDMFAEAASENLEPGYRVINLTVTARPPVRAEASVAVADDAEEAAAEPVEAA